jgi:Asp-tRNA(Asn)/Glu-tRNA(Gln) amidotransferase C subunit
VWCREDVKEKQNKKEEKMDNAKLKKNGRNVETR